MKRILLILCGALISLAFVSGIGFAADPIGVVVEKAEGGSGNAPCQYCGRLVRPGSVHRDADIIMEDVLKEVLREKGIPYTEEKDYVRYIQVSVYRFDERKGGNFAVEKPASVGFHMHLMEGKVVGRTFEFDETQKPLLNNLLEFGKFVNRGAKWVTAKQLAKEGLEKGVNSFSDLLEVDTFKEVLKN